MSAVSARSASVTVVAQALARGVSLVAVVGSTAIVARTVGIATYADWATVLSLVALVSFALDPGLSPIVVRRIAQAPDEVPSPHALVPLRLALGGGAVVVVTVIAVALRGLPVALLALALAGQLLPRAVVLNATPWLQTDHRLHRQTAWEAVTAFGGLALLGGVALAGASAPLLAIVGFTGPTAVLAVIMRRELRLTPALGRLVPGDERARVRSLIREVLPLAGALLLVATYTRIFVVFLNAGEDETVIAQYLFAFQFVEQLIVAAGIVSGAVLPLLAARGVHERLLADARTHDLLVAVGAIGAIGSAFIVATGTLATRLIGGDDLAGAGHFLELLAPMAAVVLPAFLLAYVYVAIAQAGRYLWLNVVALVANVSANAALTLTVGATATARIAWATEALVVVMALAPVARTGPSGRRAALLVLGFVALAAVAAELAASGHVPPVAAALVLAAVVAVLARRALGWMATAVLRRRA